MIKALLITLLTATLAHAQGYDARMADYVRAWQIGAAGGAIDITTGLQHYWNPGGGGGTNDLASGTRNAILFGSVATTTNGWEFGTADGNYITLGGAISNGTSYALAVWAQPNKTAMDGHVSGGWLFCDRGPPAELTTRSDFQLTYSKSSEKFRFSTHDSVNNNNSVQSTSTVINTQWVHLMGVVDAADSTVKMYVNGQLEATTTLTITPNNRSDVPAMIGNSSWFVDASRQYHGTLDKIRFYNNFAPDAEFVEAVYQADGQAKGIL